MSRTEAIEQYNKALKLGQKNHRDCVLRGRYPYPQVLDDILDDSMAAGQMDMGLIEIPTDQIVGTKAQGRRSAFAANFMPLLPATTEFAAKWVSLCEAHLGEEGIRDPIRCYEYLGRFYVQEGNKRVSVLKSYGALTITGHVIRVVPVYTEDRAIQVYYEFMQFYQRTGLYQVYFEKTGCFAKLLAALGREPDHVWTKQERQSFLSGFSYFQSAYRKVALENPPLTTAGALLVWLQVYPFEDLKAKSEAELVKSITAIWSDIKAAAQPDPIEVSTAPKAEPEKGPITRFLGGLPKKLNVAFVNERNPEDSTWVLAHEQGRKYLEQKLPDRVSVQVYDNVVPGDDAVATMEKAIAAGAQVIFTTTPPLIGACRRIAAKYPQIRVLNCSVSMPYPGVRTYYSRAYEGKFITGAIAGAMAKHDRIGYVASYPIFGVPASINAFALGAHLTNPRARIQLHWSCTPGNPLDVFTRQGITVISNRDTPTPDRLGQSWGLCQVEEGMELRPLASTYWNWGRFYEMVVRDILNGGWDILDTREEKAVNYWWGMSTGVIEVLLSDNLPDGVKQMAEILRQGVRHGTIDPFHRLIRDQAGQIRNDGTGWFSPEEILRMDWLCDWVDGSIPEFDQLLPMSRSMVRLLGVYRDRIPPEKEGTIL